MQQNASLACHTYIAVLQGPSARAEGRRGVDFHRYAAIMTTSHLLRDQLGDLAESMGQEMMACRVKAQVSGRLSLANALHQTCCLQLVMLPEHR